MIRSTALYRNAVIGKELRTRMRGWRSAAVVTVYMAILGTIAVAYLMMQNGPVTNGSSQVGITLFEALCIFQLFLVIFVTPSSTAGAISGERQRQTWELLLVTRLSSFGIVWGKLLAGIAFDLLLILASLPLFSLVFLFGGVAPQDIVHTYVVFLATILLLGSLSLLISALTARLAVSMIVSNVAALVLTIGISLLAAYLQSTEQPVVQATRFGPNGPIVPPSPPLTPLTQVDPLTAMLSALPGQSGGTLLGALGHVHHAFGLHITIELWAAFGIVSVLTSVLLVFLTTYVVRSAPPWLSRGAG